MLGLTWSIAIMAIWMAVGLLRRESWRVDNLIRIGLISPACFWITPIGIVSIVTIKVAYLAMQIGYRRAKVSRKRDFTSLLMSSHTIAALAVLCLFIAR